ncbi:hypothetical protein GQ457_06G005830 [Hibiscus cannabinus]
MYNGIERVRRWCGVAEPKLGVVGVATADTYRGEMQASELSVWQRPILIGEKCKPPRFSGLVLYDEREQLPDEDDEGDETN